MASSTIDLRIAAAASRKLRSRTVLRIAIVAVAAAAAAALALLPDPAKAASSVVVVRMTDTRPFYSPARLAIRSGETVEWINDGHTVHSVSTSAGNAQKPGDTAMPRGATAFDSGFIPPGDNYSYTFTVPGSYRYFCLPHEKAGMFGVVVVRR